MTLKIECALHGSTKTALEAIQRSIAKKKYKVARCAAEEPQIPANAFFEPLFAAESNERRRDLAVLPSVAECAAHLELLECLFALRQRVLKSDELDAVFGIAPHHRVVKRDGKDVKLKDNTLWERRQVKWTRFVEWAVVRFLCWRRVLMSKSAQTIGWQMSDDNLPPLDVIMVLHSFFLNPSIFLLNGGMGPLNDVIFPWRAIHKAIDNGNWGFALSAPASVGFQDLVGLKPDLFEEMLSWKDLPASKRNALLRFNFASTTLYPWTPRCSSAETTQPAVFDPSEKSLGTALSAAVIRQGNFIEKMNNKLWIRSPALEGTLTRAISRYSQFLTLTKLNPSSVLVPTLDIDLVWHTHQCSPVRYLIACKQLIGRFLNHNDNVAKGKLNDGFAMTRGLYLVKFGREYRICGCWNCEALLSALQAAKNNVDAPSEEEIMHKVCAEVSYYWSVEAARIKQQPLPVRN
jgi:hypothetical protein